MVAIRCLPHFISHHDLDGREQGQHVERKESVPGAIGQGRRVTLGGIAFPSRIPHGKGVASDRVHYREDRRCHGIRVRRHQGRHTDLGQGFKNVLVTALDAIEGLGVLARPLRVQVREFVAFVHVLFAVLSGEIRVLCAGGFHREAVNGDPKAHANENKGGKASPERRLFGPKLGLCEGSRHGQHAAFDQQQRSHPTETERVRSRGESFRIGAAENYAFLTFDEIDLGRFLGVLAVCCK